MDEALKPLLDSIRTPEHLRRLLDIEGVDDAFIAEFVESVGAGVVLDQVFDLMAARYAPERAKGRHGVVQWNVRTPSGRPRHYQLALAPHGAVARRGKAVRPKVTLTLAAPDLLRLCAGRLRVVPALRDRSLRVSGNLLFGARLPRWFDY
ncbi:MULTISPECIES: SCP2 sterol-binding domain-containing protein [Actinomadura]|uniref:SCP2 sterol-binding domain-containing protein n=1 Tax=Actinomadura yumaensis TaxID=111807 RepID=A0ABW2CH29_9ACTN|nr:SCP2 sterol-binding domain-containing protein [Actinomadura sp. J1-007]